MGCSNAVLFVLALSESRAVEDCEAGQLAVSCGPKINRFVHLNLKTQRDARIKKKKNEDAGRINQKESGLFYIRSW